MDVVVVTYIPITHALIDKPIIQYAIIMYNNLKCCCNHNLHKIDLNKIWSYISNL